MPDLPTLLLFAATSLVLIIAPGPDIIFLLIQGATNGAKAGVATALGLAAGNLLHTLAAAVGVSAIISSSAYAFTVLKIAGACYLLYLAYKTIRSQPTPSEQASPQGDPVVTNKVDLPALMKKGFVMNILNPKVALFFLAFLPQFVTPQIAPAWQQLLILGTLFTLLVALLFSLFGILAGYLGARMLHSEGALGKYLKWPIAGIFVGLAIKLALSEK